LKRFGRRNFGEGRTPWSRVEPLSALRREAEDVRAGLGLVPGGRWLLGPNHPVVVAVAAMRMVQMLGHQEVGVVTVRNGFVTASASVAVAGIVRLAGVRRRAAGRVGPGDRQRVLVDVIAVDAVEVPIVDVVGVPVVLDADVAALRAMGVRVVRVDLVFAHSLLLSSTIL
jgi:hypothetical protein